MHFGCREVSKWLKSKTLDTCSTVVNMQGEATETWHDGARAIDEFWDQFWSDLNSQAGVTQNNQAANLTCPTGNEFQSRAQDASGCAGTDGWTAQEIIHLPSGVCERVAKLFEEFAEKGELPFQFKKPRMVCLAKPGKARNFGIQVGDARARFVWQRGTFSTCVNVSGSLATKGGPWTPTVFCVTGVALSACQARFVWQAWHFQYLHRCPRKLGDEEGPMDADGLLRDRRDTFSISGSICVAGVALSVPA